MSLDKFPRLFILVLALLCLSPASARLPHGSASNGALSPPGAVISLASPSQTSSTVTLTWGAGAGSAATSWPVTQRTPCGSGSYSSASGTFVSSGGTVTGLAASTCYDFQVGASNAAGNSSPATLSSISTTSGGATTFSLASYVSSGFTGNAVQITLGWTGSTPSSATASWSGGGGAATISGFTVTGPFATFYASTPAGAGTYTLSGTGWTTGNIVVSAAVADLSTGINGPTNVMLGQDSYGTGITPGIASYVARGLAGPATWTLTGTNAAGFTISGIGLLVPVFDGNTGTYGCNATVCNVTLNVTDGVTTLTPKAVTVQRPVSGTHVATVNSNTVFDTATANGSLSSQLGYSAAFVTNLALWSGGSATMSDPSGHFALVNSAQIAVRMADITTYGTYPLTITPSGGSAFVYNVTIAHERNPVIAWQPNGAIYSSTPATNGYGSNRIGTLASSDDQSTLTYAYSSNPTGALNSYSYDPYYGRTGYTYLLSSVSAGTLAGTAAITSTTAKSTSIVFTLPVAAGTTLASSNMGASVVGGLDNFQPSARIQANGLHVPGTTKVADLTFSGLTPDQSLSDITVIDSNAQLTRGVIFFGIVYYPQYTLVWTSATTAELHAWWLSAANDTTAQVDNIQVTVADGTGKYLSKTVDITTSWHTCTQGPLSVGPGGTWTTGAAMGAAINGAPSTYAGCKVKVLSGIDPTTWQWTPYGGSSYYGYLLAPIILEGDTAQSSQIAMNFNGTALGGNGQGCVVNGGGYDLIVRRLEVYHCSNGNNAGAFYKFNEQPGNFTVQLSYAHNSDMGYEGGDIGTRVYLIDNLFAANGNGPSGSSHNIYVDGVAQLTVTGNYSVDSMAHEMKWRALKATITDNFFLEGMNWYGWASPVQQAQGGKVTFDRNVVMKGVNDNFANNGNIIEPFNEWTVPMWAVNEFHANNNTLINLVVPGQTPPYQPAVGFTQVSGNADPVRNIPFVYDLNTTGFWNLAQAQWTAGSFGATAPTLATGNVAVNAYPSTGVALINPLTGVAPVNLPYRGHQCCNVGMIGSAATHYDMVMTVAAGASVNTNITGGLVTGRDSSGTQMTGQSVTALTSGYTSSVSSNNIQLKVPAGLTNGIEYPQLTISGSGVAPLPGATFLPLIVGTGGASDGFVSGIYLPTSTWVSPDTTISTPLMSGFVRGVGTTTYSVANSTGGSAYVAVTVDSTTSRTSNFTVKATAAGLALSPTGNFPPTVTITATNSSGSFPVVVTFNALASGTDIAVPGGNVLSATQAQSGGRWVLAPGAFLKAYTPTPTSTSGDALLPANTFSTYVRCAGDYANFGYLSNQAKADSVIPEMLAGTPFFVAGFVRPEDHTTFGMGVGLGNNIDKQFGLGGLTMGGALTSWYFFEWVGASSFNNIAFSSQIYNSNTDAVWLGQWTFTAVKIGVANAVSIFTDGVTTTGSPAWQTPTVNFFAPTLSTMFCSYEGAGGDAHSFNGGIRNWVAVGGVPTDAELRSFRTGGDPLTIWPGRVRGYWAFTADPQTGAVEPDLSGNGKNLTYYNYGSASGSALPYLVTNEVPWLMDGSGLFELDVVSGTAYALKTTSGVVSLPAHYGTFNVILVDKYGHEFPTTLYINDGS